LEELLATFHTGDTVPAETGAERALRAEMLRQRDLLRRRARLLGELVYAERPKAFRRRIAAYWRQAERAAEADPESAGG